MREFFLLPVHGEKVAGGRMRGSVMRSGNLHKTTRARSLRRNENEAEDALWTELRARRLNGYKFVRQFPVGPYFADFACREKMLVVEVDGSQHAGSERDRFRDESMNRNGWSILRFWHAEVLTQRRAVTETIVAVLDGRLARTSISAEMKFLPASQDVEANR